MRETQLRVGEARVDGSPVPATGDTLRLRRRLRRAAFVTAGLGSGLAILVLLGLAGLYVGAAVRLNRRYDVQPQAVVVPTTAEAVEYGRQRYSVYCAGCHGDNLAGTAFFDDPALGRIPARNLTAGTGGVGGQYTDADWVRAIRHGVSREGKPLLVMPADALKHLSDADLGAIIAYVKRAASVDNDLGHYAITPLAHVLISAGAFGNVISAESIDHRASPPAAPPRAVSAAYGQYLVDTVGCRACHGAALSGGKDPNPQAPPAPNLTPGGALRSWNEATFITSIRTRQSPFMPFKDLSHLSDDELKALWLYLQSLPSKETGKS